MFKISVEVEGIYSRLAEALFAGVAIATAKKARSPGGTAGVTKVSKEDMF